MTYGNHTISFGAEEEFFMLPKQRIVTTEFISTEVFDDQIEIKTPICGTPHDLITAIGSNRAHLSEILPDTQLIAMGTNPFKTSSRARFLKNDNNASLFGELAHPLQQLYTCGFHVHISIGDEAKSLEAINKLRFFIPFLISISGNSRTYFGTDTQYSSFRNQLFASIPRAGIPPSVKDYNAFLASYRIDTNQYTSQKTWYDIRFNKKHGSVEFRLFDANPDIRKINFYVSIATVLFIACLDGPTSLKTPDYILYENRWRACRFGKDCVFIAGKKLMSSHEVCKQLLDGHNRLIESLGLSIYLKNFNSLFYGA